MKRYNKITKKTQRGQKTNGSRQKKKNNTFGDTQRQFEF